MSNNYIDILFHRIKNHFLKYESNIKIYPEKNNYTNIINNNDKVKTNYNNITIETKLSPINELDENKIN